MQGPKPDVLHRCCVGSAVRARPESGKLTCLSRDDEARKTVDAVRKQQLDEEPTDWPSLVCLLAVWR